VTESADDKAYPAAAAKALGRMWGEMFVGMVEAGMTREEAMEVTVEYAAAMAPRPVTPTEGDHNDR